MEILPTKHHVTMDSLKLLISPTQSIHAVNAHNSIDSTEIIKGKLNLSSEIIIYTVYIIHNTHIQCILYTPATFSGVAKIDR